MLPGAWSRVARASGLLGADGALSATIFAEMSALAARTGAVNLGQGFPDTDGPASLLDAASSAILSGVNQYPPGRGVPELRTAIAAHQKRWYSLEVDPEREVLVTAGATEALTASVLALCEPGDEVIVLEPYYDSYAAAIELAGAVRVPVRLSWPSWSLSESALEAAVTDRTRLVLLNSPHNPTGRVLSGAELAAVAALARSRDLLVVSDEVYEHLTFGVPYVPIATLPGMADRTITISSAGKTFSVTGWKIGWLHARADLVDAVLAVKQFLTYVNGAPFQPAVAAGLALPDEVFASFSADLGHRHDLLVAALDAAGFGVRPSEGTYFVIADAAPLGFPDGRDLCRRLPELAGVVAVPVQAFLSGGEPSSLVRFACCKRLDVLERAAEGLRRLRA